MGATREPGHTGKLERDPLEGDLVWAAHLLLRNCYRLASDQHEVDHPTLAQTVRNIVGDQQWHDDSNGSLIRVLRDAIAHVPEELNGRRPEYPPEKTNTRSKWYGKPERQMAGILYGVGQNLPARRYQGDGTEMPRDYDTYYRRVAFEVASLDGLNDGDKNRVTHVIRQDLAAALRAMEQETLMRHQQATEHTAQAEPVEPQPGDISRQYINRPVYEAWFTEQRERGTRIFLLHGDAGTGKTTLARHFGEISPGDTASAADTATSAQLSTDPLVEIGTRTSAVLHDDLLRTLHRRRMDTPGQSVLVRELFRELLESPQAPGVVLFDNTEEESWDEVRDLLPDMPQSTIIITSRYRLRLPAGAAALAVGEMTDDEAVAMVRSQLTSVSDEDASALASDLGNRPLAIRHACGYITQEVVSVSEFRRLLKQDIAAVLDSVADGDHSLTAIYRLTLERLDVDTLRVLDLVTVLGGDKVSAEFLHAAWCKDPLFSVRPKSDESLQSLAFRKALRALERRSLVETTYLTDKHVVGRVVVHPLTTELILQLRRESFLSLVDELHKAIENASTLTEWQPGKSLPNRLVYQVITGALFAFKHLGTPDGSPYEYDNLFKLRAAYVHSVPVTYWQLEDTSDPLAAFTRRYIETQKEPPPSYWNRVPVQPRFHWTTKGLLRKLIWDLRHYGLVAPGPIAEVTYRRVTGTWTILEDELIYFSSIFPLLPKVHEDFRMIGIPKEAMVTPYLSQGVEHHPFVHDELHDLLGDQSEHSAPHVVTLRKQALRAEYEGNLFEAGNIYFALGTYYFDRSDFTCALANYKRSHDIWSRNDPRYYVGELCKAATRVSDTYSRLGRYDEALTWRSEVAFASVASHIKQYGLDEWLGGVAENYFLHCATRDPRLPAPSLSQLRLNHIKQHYWKPEDRGDDHPESAEEVITETDEDWHTYHFGEGSRDELEGSQLAIVNSVRIVFGTAFRFTLAPADGTRQPREYINLLQTEHDLAMTWPLARPKLRLFMVKMYMYLDETEGTRSSSDDTLRDVRAAAQVFKEELKSPYWYADSLLTAYVLCARYDCGTPEQAEALFQELWDAHHKIRRTDRLRIALAARDKKLHFDPLWLFAELCSSPISTSNRPTTITCGCGHVARISRR
jgi:tetratricopeptide (TPR) repeat protein